MARGFRAPSNASVSTSGEHDDSRHAELEATVLRLCDAGQWQAAVTEVIRGHGPEILGYLCALTRRDHEASELFSDFCEDLWRGLAGFRREARLRTWLYRLAFHCHARAARSAIRRGQRFIGLDDAHVVEDAIEKMRTATLPHLRTDVKAEVMRIREQLDPEDQSLLILRVDRGLTWDEIAEIVDDEGSQESIKRSAATLRKRFERVKNRLRTLAAHLAEEE